MQINTSFSPLPTSLRANDAAKTPSHQDAGIRPKAPPGELRSTQNISTLLDIDVNQMSRRFLLFEKNAQRIAMAAGQGAALSVDDGIMLKEYDQLRDDLRFLRPSSRRSRAIPPQRDAKPAPPVPPSADPAPASEYVGGVRIKSDYSLSEVLDSTADALRNPFGSFVASAKDLVKKVKYGTPLSGEEREAIYRYASIADTFLMLTPQGQLMKATGATFATINDAIKNRPVTPESAASRLIESTGFATDRRASNIHTPVVASPDAGETRRRPRGLPGRPDQTTAAPG
jgi:hypothetical protein